MNSNFWSEILPSWLSAIGTVGAVIVALWLSLKQNRIKYMTAASLDKESKKIIFRIVNKGFIPIHIDGLFFYADKEWHNASGDLHINNINSYPAVIDFSGVHECGIDIINLANYYGRYFNSRKPVACFISVAGDKMKIKLSNKVLDALNAKIKELRHE